MVTAVEVMGEARAQTGLTDFGDDSFREGLDILLSSLRKEARLHDRGQAFLHHRIVGYLSSPTLDSAACSNAPTRSTRSPTTRDSHEGNAKD